MADDIMITVGIDPQDAIDKANDLQKAIKDIFDKTTGKSFGKKFDKELDRIKKQINSTALHMEKLKRAMAVEATKVGFTPQYQKELDILKDLQKELTKYKKAAAKPGLTGQALADAKRDVRNTQRKISYRNNKLTKLEAAGEKFADPRTSEEYRRLGEQLGQDVNTMRMLISAARELTGEAIKANSTWSQFKSRLEHIKKTANKILTVFRRIVTPITKAVSALGKLVGKMSGLNKASEKHNTSLKKMINQVLRYGLGIRSLFILWRKLRTYTADALKLMATQFREVDEDVSALMNSFNQMKLSFGTMAQPLMHALRPALVYIIELITRATTALANFFAILTGQKYIYKAQKANDSYADSIKGVGSAAKEANKELAEYDNLLVIKSPNDGSGGGGGGAAEGLTGTFEKTLAESDFAKQLKDAINRGDWEGVGGLFANKLNIITKTFDNWINKKFRPKAVTWASRIGRILNGLTEGWDSNLTGKTVADTLNAILDTTNTFFKTYKFKRLGEKVGGLIKGFFDNMNPVLLGETLANKINAVIDFATGLIDTTPWAEIGDKLGTALKTWFETVKWEDLGADLQKLASGILTSLAHFIQTSNLGTTVGTAINRFLSQIDFGQLAEDLSTCAISILDAIADLIVTIDWHRVGEAIADFLTHIDWLGLIAKLAEVALSLLGAFAEALSGLASNPSAILKIAEALLAIFAVKKIWSMLTGLFSTNLGSAITSGISLAKVAVAAGTWELAGRGAGKLFEGIASALGEEELAKEYGEFAKGPTKYLVNAISTGVEAATEYSETTGRSTLGNAVHMLFGEDITGMAIKSAKDASDAANETFQRAEYSYDVLGLHELVSDEEWEKFKNSCDDYVAEINRLQEETQKSTKDVKDSFDSIPTSAKEAMQKAAQETSDGTESITESVHVMANGVPSEVEEAMKKASEPFHVMANGIPSEVEEAMKQTADSMVTSFDDVPEELGNTGQSALQSIESPFESLPADMGTTAGSALDAVTQSFKQDALTGHFTAVKENIETPFKELPAFFNDTFEESWNKAESAFSSGETTFNSFNEKISDGMTSTINGLIDGLNDSVATPFRKIQEVIEKFKNMKIGTNAIFSNIPSFSGIPSIPHLAQGAVIPPNKEFLAMLGDQTQGTNIETPLETMVQAFKQALSEMSSSNNQNIVLQLDGRIVAQCVWDEEDKRYKQTGRR